MQSVRCGCRLRRAKPEFVATRLQLGVGPIMGQDEGMRVGQYLDRGSLAMDD